jgi:serine/threonine-protein phosphatase 2A regulatory subunit A
LKEIAPVVSGDSVSKEIVPLALNMAVDPIPNIRFNVAKLFGAISKFTTTNDKKDKIKPILSKLVQDEDVDVRYYAQKSLEVF